MSDQINHPEHYGGYENAYEAIKVIEAWGLCFSLGNTLKYISRAGKKENNNTLQDLEKAKWYLYRKVEIITFPRLLDVAEFVTINFQLKINIMRNKNIIEPINQQCVQTSVRSIPHNTNF